jgi:hypothetical protein
LSKLIEEKMNKDPRSGNIYVFSNKARTIVKMVKWWQGDDGPALYKKHFSQPLNWPEFGGPPIILSGKDVKAFLKGIKYSDME